MKRLLIPLALLVLAAPSSARPGWRRRARRLAWGRGHLHPDPPGEASRAIPTPRRQAKTFAAADGRGRRLRGKVVFPSEGKWSYRCTTGFAVRGADTPSAPSTSTGGGGTCPPSIGIIGLALVAIVFFSALAPRRVRAPAPANCSLHGGRLRPPA
jgi:hypothetical protein